MKYRSFALGSVAGCILAGVVFWIATRGDGPTKRGVAELREDSTKGSAGARGENSSTSDNQTSIRDPETSSLNNRAPGTRTISRSQTQEEITAKASKFANTKLPLLERLSSGVTDVLKISNPESVASIVKVLDDREDDYVARSEAVIILRRSPFAPKLTQRLVKLLKTPEESARFRVGCIQHLQRQYEVEKEGAALDGIRWAIIESGVEILQGRAIQAEGALSKILNWPEKAPEKYARFKEHVAQCLDAKSAVPVQVAAVGAIAKARAVDQVGTLESILEELSRSIDVRAAAASALGSLGQPTSIAALEKVANSNNPRLTAACRAALQRIPRRRR